MNFRVVKLYEFKIKDPNTKKIGWLNYTNFNINIVRKKDCQLLRKSFQEIK